MLAILPLVVLLFSFFQKRLVKANREIREINSNITSNFNEGITGAKTIKTLAIEQSMEDRFIAETGLMKKRSVQAARLRGLFAATMSFASSAALAIAKMAGIVPVMAPGLTDSLADLDALAASARMVFCGKVTPDRALLYSSRGVPVLRQEPGQLTDAYLVLRDLELSESAVIPCGETLGDLAEAASAVAIDLKKRTNFT